MLDTPQRHSWQHLLRSLLLLQYALLLDLLSNDPSPWVRAAAAAGFGHLEAYEQARGALIKAAKDPIAEVRSNVAFAPAFDHDLAATNALLELMDDDDGDVRDWATFGIGDRPDDSPTIREALLRRITDSNEEARLEAFAGLAARKDQRIVAQLIEIWKRIPKHQDYGSQHC